MTAESRSVEDIEREIERDRAHLSDRLGHLNDQISVEGALREVGDQCREHGAAVGKSLSRTIRDNPTAAALTGAGLAWLVVGASRTSQDSNGEARRSAVSASRGRSDGGRHVPAWVTGETPDTDGQSLADRLDEARHRVSEAASDARDAASDRAERLRERLEEGTEALSEEARERVVSARIAARRAREAASEGMSAASTQLAETGRRAEAFYERQPLVAGALAFALGAAIGSALPRTRREDDSLGEKSDDLIDKAERLLREELEKARAVAGAASEEARSVASEKKREVEAAAPSAEAVAESIADELEDASRRIAKAASKKARQADLGKVRS